MKKLFLIICLFLSVLAIQAKEITVIETIRVILKEQSSTPSTLPAAGTQLIYPKTDGFWYVLNSAGVETRLTPHVLSVFGRTGTVTAQVNDYTWAQIDKTISNIADITNRSHTSLTDIGTNTHAQIDAHISNTSNPHAVTPLQIGLGNVDDTSDANKPISTATQNALDAKEDSANKATDFTTINDILYPTVKAVNDAINNAITGLGVGDMLKSVYDSNDDGKVNSADLADDVDISSLPTEASPASGMKLIIDNGGTRKKIDWDDLASGGGGGLTFEVISSNTNAVSGKFYIIDASSNTVTLTLLGSPTVDDKIGYKVLDATNTVTITRNGNNIKGAAADLTPAAGVSEVITWSGNATEGWTTAYDKTPEAWADYSFDWAATTNGVINIARSALDVPAGVYPGVEIWYLSGTTLTKRETGRAPYWDTSTGNLVIDVSDFESSFAGMFYVKFSQAGGTGVSGGGGSGDMESSTYDPLGLAEQIVGAISNQIIYGIKTFDSFPVTPSSAPTSDYQVANKKYVDDNAGGGSITMATFQWVYTGASLNWTSGYSTWTTVTINTSLSNGISGASLASNRITLPAGTYIINANVTGQSNSANTICQCRIYNYTDSATILAGVRSDDGLSASPFRPVVGSFTLAAEKAIEFQVYFSNRINVDYITTTTGENRILANIFIQKLP